MFTWPGTSALLGVTCNFIAISIIFFFAYSSFAPEPFCEEPSVTGSENIASTSDTQQQNATRRRHASQGSNERTDSLERLAVVSNGRFKPTGSKHRSFKVKKFPQSASITPHEYECTDGLLRCNTFPPYRWECEGERVGTCTETQALWGAAVCETRCSASRSCSLSSGASGMGRTERHAGVTCPASEGDGAADHTKLRQGKIQLAHDASTNTVVSPESTYHDMEYCNHANHTHLGHANMDIGNISGEKDGVIVFDSRRGTRQAVEVRRLADGECSCEPGTSYDRAPVWSRRSSHSSNSSEECTSLHCTHTRKPLCTVHGTIQTDSIEHATVICKCGAAQMHVCDRPFKGRVPDGAPAQREFVKQIGHSGHNRGLYTDGSMMGDTSGTSDVIAGQAKYEDPSQKAHLKRFSVSDKSRASFRRSFKKMISRK